MQEIYTTLLAVAEVITAATALRYFLLARSVKKRLTELTMERQEIDRKITVLAGRIVKNDQKPIDLSEGHEKTKIVRRTRCKKCDTLYHRSENHECKTTTEDTTTP